MKPLQAPLCEAFFHQLPKVELHCHLLGTVRQATFGEWVRRERAPISQEEIEAFYTRGKRPVGVLRVLRALEQHLLKHPDDLARLMREYLQSAAAHHVRYAEVFWNPTGTAVGSGIAYADGLAALREAMRQAQQRWGIASRLIPAIDREASPRAAEEMVAWVLAHPCEEVVGIGIDYREVDHPPQWFAGAYSMARKAGLKTTAHAGEFGMPWTNVRTAVELLQVDRIDHGYTVVDEPSFARQCAERGIVFTVVPTNSYYLRTLPPERWAQEHPIRRMPGLGLKIHPNTDDPTLHHVTPTQAWHKMHQDFGFDAAALRQFMHHGIEAAWVDEATQARWHNSFALAFDQALNLALHNPPPEPHSSRTVP